MTPPAQQHGLLNVVVAPLRRQDLDAVLAIEQQVFDEPWSKALFEGELAQRTSRSYRAAWVGAELVGYAGQMTVDDEAHVNNVAVSPQWTGKHIGMALFYDLVCTALERGSAHLTLEVAVGNAAAVALYARFGLAPVGVRPDYYRDGDAFIMWARDIDTPDYAARLGAIEASLGAEVALERRH